jgi:hypothetical protein
VEVPIYGISIVISFLCLRASGSRDPIERNQGSDPSLPTIDGQVRRL